MLHKQHFCPLWWLKALTKVRNLDIKDERGIKGGHNKTSEESVNGVISFINKIPKYVSHYWRENTSKEYLPTDLTVEKLYKQYAQDTDNPVKLPIFKIFMKILTWQEKRWKRTLVICVTYAISVITVSYTHLDVYKRQRYCLLAFSRRQCDT